MISERFSGNMLQHASQVAHQRQLPLPLAAPVLWTELMHPATEQRRLLLLHFLPQIEMTNARLPDQRRIARDNADRCMRSFQHTLQWANKLLAEEHRAEDEITRRHIIRQALPVRTSA